LPSQANLPLLKKYYYTYRGCRIDFGNGKIRIINYDTKMLYNLDSISNNYTEIDMTKLEIPNNDINSQDQDTIIKFTNHLKSKVKVTKTNETETIQGYDCVKYDVTFFDNHCEYWVTKSLKNYEEIEEISKKMDKSFEKNPMVKEMDLIGFIDKMDGFPIKIVTKVVGFVTNDAQEEAEQEIGKVTTTLKKIEYKDLRDDLFEVPNGYVLQAVHQSNLR
jgi:hypothetical protein